MISSLGMKVSELAYPLLILSITHSPAKAGLVPIFWLGPFMIFGLPAGALIDRWDRRRVMLICDSVRLLALASVPVAFVTHLLSLPLIYGAALAEGFAFCFFNLAETACVSQVVGKEQLPNAMAANEASYSITATIGPAFAGQIMALARTQIVGAVLAFAVDSVTYIASIVGLFFMKTKFQETRVESDEKRSIWHEIGEGMTFLWNQERIRSVAIWAGWLALVFGPFQLAAIVMVRTVFHMGAGTIGVIFSVGGIGGLFGAAIAPQLKEKVPFGKLLLAVVLVQSIATLVQAVSPNLIVLAAMEFVIAVANPAWSITQMSYRLSIIPDELQGRVNACFRLLIFIAFPVGSAIGGALLERIGPRDVFGIMATGGFVSVVAVWFTKLRRA